MARKEDAGLIEKHVEKIVLAAAALILVVVGVHWGMGSPCRIKLDLNARGISMPKKEYSPDEIDNAVGEASTKLEKILVKKKVVVKPLPKYVRQLKVYYENPYNDRDVHSYVNFGPEYLPPKRTLVTDRKVEPIRLADLMPLPKPEKPLIKACREVQVISTPDGEVKYKEVDVARGATVFENGKVLKDWKKALEKTYVSARVVFVAVETQRRYQMPDGSWSEPEPVALVVMPDAPTLPVIPEPDEKNLLEIQQAIDELAEISNQEYILQSPYYDIVWPNQQTGTWQIRNHKPRTRVSELLEQEDEKPAGAGMLMPEGRTAAERREAAKREAAKRAAAKKRAAEKRAAERRAAERRARQSGARDRMPGMGPPGMGLPGERLPPGARRPGARRPGERQPGERRPGERLPGERRPAKKRPKPSRRTVEIDAPIVVSIPTFQEQLDNPAGILEVWFHDTSLARGMTYSYRTRLVLVNPLLGRFKDVANKTDAKDKVLKTPWSDWSESVEVKRPTEFFLVGSAPHSKTVVVEVFTQRWGQRVSERFTIGRGEPIGGDKSKELLQLGTGEPVKTVVSFKTGVIAVSFNFGKRQRVPGTNSFRTTTTEMLYLDASGKLRTRTRLADESSQRYKNLLKEVRQATGSTTADVR